MESTELQDDWFLTKMWGQIMDLHESIQCAGVNVLVPALLAVPAVAITAVYLCGAQIVGREIHIDIHFQRPGIANAAPPIEI